MNEKQTTSNQLLCSTEKIDFKKKIVSTVTIKSLMKQKVRKNKRSHASSERALERSSKLKNRV